jgi:DNA-binding NarL/FixJ family response regulator
MTLPPLRILLVEGDDAYAEMIDAEFRRADVAAELRRAPTLADARRPAAHEGIDVVLLDLALPDSAGLDTLRAMRASLADVPIVVLTAANCDVLAVTAVRSGAQDYLVKGETGPRLLVRALRHACERALARQDASGPEWQPQTEAAGRIAGSLAHDFNNALTSIFGYVDLLLDGVGPGDPRRHDILEIRRSAERASAQARQLLAFGRGGPRRARVFDLDDEAEAEAVRHLVQRSHGGTFVESEDGGASRLVVCLTKAGGA